MERSEQIIASRAGSTFVHLERPKGPLLAAFPGFGPMTLIETDFGHFPAQALRIRDRVRSRNGRYCQIARAEKVLLDEAFLERNPAAQPVLIERGRLGPGLPSEPVLLAPGQRVSDRQGLPASFQTAGDLLRAGVAHRRPEKFMTYVRISFVEAADVCSGGLWLRVEPPVSETDED